MVIFTYFNDNINLFLVIVFTCFNGHIYLFLMVIFTCFDVDFVCVWFDVPVNSYGYAEMVR